MLRRETRKEGREMNEPKNGPVAPDGYSIEFWGTIGRLDGRDAVDCETLEEAIEEWLKDDISRPEYWLTASANNAQEWKLSAWENGQWTDWEHIGYCDPLDPIDAARAICRSTGGA